MGKYLNPKSIGFQESLRSEIYVDKSLLISELNDVVRTKSKFVCMSRPRRFGKSMALEMLAAYYQCDEDTHRLFDNLKIAKAASYEEHINKYLVVYVDMQEVLSQTHDVQLLIDFLQERILNELREECCIKEEKYLFYGLNEASEKTGKQFIFLIDEWDCVMREMRQEKQQQELYLDFIRGLFKGQTYVAMAYMTGILPVKKYGTHSALNMFDERSIIDPGSIAEYFGFTEEETRALCQRYNRSFEETRRWYDGYELLRVKNGVEDKIHIYNPNSVVKAMLGRFRSYWNSTERFEALANYIKMNYKGLREDVTSLLAGEEVKVDITSFANDMETFYSKNDILTLLIHLGYLTYDEESCLARIPNHEVYGAFITSVNNSEEYATVAAAIADSTDLLKALWRGRTDEVCAGIKKAHQEMPILRRNDENSLACVVSLALYCARDYYTIVRELPAGEGFADMVFIPKPSSDKPAMLVELKWDKDAETALKQIERQQYPAALEAYKDDLLLVGINYDKDTHNYECKIISTKDKR